MARIWTNSSEEIPQTTVQQAYRRKKDGTTTTQTTVEGHDSKALLFVRDVEHPLLFQLQRTFKSINLENGTEIVIGADIVLPAELEITKEIINGEFLQQSY